MRGCPGKCRFCQSTTLKRPLRFRKVETIVAAAMEQYRTTGYNEISLLSLSSSDYPQFDELMRRLQETFRPLGVAVSLPSLRVNEELRLVGELLNTDRHSGLTLSPEAARDEMSAPAGQADPERGPFCRLPAGVRERFFAGKTLFHVRLAGRDRERSGRHPGNVGGDLAAWERTFRALGDGGGERLELRAEAANAAAMARHAAAGILSLAHEFLLGRNRFRSVQLRCHDVESSLLEGVLCRGDRRVGEAIELAWRRGARLDAWTEHLHPERWWPALDDAGIDADEILHQPYPAGAPLPWDHIQIRQGREYLHREHQRAGE